MGAILLVWTSIFSRLKARVTDIAKHDSSLRGMSLLQTPGYHVAYVGNVDFNANQDQLRGVFKSCEVTVVR